MNRVTHTNESCHTYKSIDHLRSHTYENIMSHVENPLKKTSRALLNPQPWTQQTTAAHRNTLQHTKTHCNTPQRLYEVPPSPSWVTHITLMNESYHDHSATHYHTLQHAATRCNTAQHTATGYYTRVERGGLEPPPSPWWVTHSTLMNESCHDHSAALFNTLQHAATRCNTLQHTSRAFRGPPAALMRRAQFTCVCDVTRSCVTWLIHICDMTHIYVWHDSFICVTWLIHMCVTRHIHMCEMTHIYVWHDSFICVTWLLDIARTAHLCVWRDSIMCAWYNSTWLVHMCVTWPNHMCDMTHLYVWHDLFMCVTRHIHKCDTTHLYVWRELFMCGHDSPSCLSHVSGVNDSCHIDEWVIHMNESCHTYEWVMSQVWMIHVT